GGKNIAIMGETARIIRPTAPAAKGDHKPILPDSDFDLLDFASPLPTASNAGLEYVDGSIELLKVGSAVYAVDTHYASPSTGVDLPDLHGPDF
ncbi:MAG: hypothetical protein K2X31_02100, partial [Sphingopyxis sp.]|nr:hypothetical protein [Sphingopyxis sp.]